MLITSIILLILAEHVLAEDLFLIRNEYDNRRSYDETFDKKFKMIHDNYSRVVSSALKHNVDISSDCGEVFKNVQHLVQSPGYPNSYPHNLECEFTFMSPFVCRNQFHVQFIDFDVEPSKNCSKDYVRVGTDDILCGQVIGIKKYDTKAGVLKIKLVTDRWESRKGFQLLVTRLPCNSGENNSGEVTTTVFPIYTDDDQLEINTIKPATVDILTSYLPKTSNRQDIPPPIWDFPPPTGVPPSVIPLPPNSTPNCFQTIFRCCQPWSFPQYPQYPEINPGFPQIPPTGGNQNPLYPVPPIGNIPNYPSYPNFYPNNPPYPNFHQNNPLLPPYLPPAKPWSPIEIINVTSPKEDQQIIPGYPQFGPGYPQIIPPRPQIPVQGAPGLTQCCRNIFHYRRFYLVSPGFPIPNRRPTDCLYVIERAAPNTCRLRVEFKFFNHGNEFDCLNDFVEIDGNRVCGCKTSVVYTSQWGAGPKTIRYRNSGYDQGPFKGFVLDIIQETCPFRYETASKRIDNKLALPISTIAKQTGQKVVRTNSTSVSTYYQYMDEDEAESANQVFKHSNLIEPALKDREIEKAKFFYSNPGGPNESRCQLTTIEWLVLKKSALFIQQPACYRY